MTKARWIALKDIKVDGGTQSRVALDDSAIEDYSQALDILPPVIVFDDRDNYWLADGFHRYRAHEIVGSEEILAEVRRGTQRDAILFSVGANASHGLRRTNADKRHAILTLLNDPEWGKWSDREIAFRCSVSDKTVASLRPVTADFRSERAYKTKHGSTATMKTAGINADRRQREPNPVRIVERTHQQPAAPVVVEEPAELDDGALNAAEQAVKRRRRFLALWEEMTPADREWTSQTISHWKNSLPAHDSNTGEIIEEPNSSGCQDAVGVGQPSLPEGTEPAGAASTINSEPDASSVASVGEERFITASGADEGPPRDASPHLLTSEPPPETGSGKPERPFLVEPEPNLSPDPAPIAPAEDAVAASVSGQGAPAASSNLPSDDWANSHEVRSAPEMPDFLRRAK